MITRRTEKEASYNDLFTGIVIGMSDGLIVPFALSAGLSGVVSSGASIALAGSTAVALGALVMAWGGYQAGKNEPLPIDAAAHARKEKTFFANLGLSEEMQQKAAEEIAKDEQQWAELMQEEDPAISGLEKPTRSALHIGLSYVAGGLIPICPYFFTTSPVDGLKISAVLTLVALFIFGFSKGRLTGTHPWASAIRVMLTGALAAAGAFGVAKLFDQ